MTGSHMARNAHQVLDQWRHQLLDDLSADLPTLLDHTIDTLMLQAESAKSNQLQTCFFHAQQELRRDKARVNTDFLASLDRLMHQAPRPLTGQPLDAEDLGLVNIEAFERNVAIQRFTDRAAQDHYPVLHQLRHRLSVVFDGAPLQDDDIPGSPMQLLSALDQALSPLKLERLAAQVIFANFDTAIMRKYAGQRYQALNTQLRDAGILPNLHFQIVHKKIPVGAGRRGPAQANADGVAATGRQGGEMDALVQQIRELMPNSRPGHPSGPAAAVSPVEVARLIDDQRHYLAGLLPEHGVFGPAGAKVVLQAGELADSLKALIRQRHEIKRMIGPEQLSVFDESTLDIVGALFEIMLNDSTLPDATKALFSHLHTPYLKLALRERELLGDQAHPARKLLDELVEAGEIWGHVDQLGDGIFPVLQDIVEVLRSTDTPDSELVEQQRDYLGKRVETLYKRQQLRISRTRDTEIGRARLDQAKHKAETAIVQLLEEASPCQACGEFLSGPWHDYLTLLLLRSDCQAKGPEWEQADRLGRRIAGLASDITAPVPPPAEALDALQQELATHIGAFIPHYMADVEKLIRAMQGLRSQDRSLVGKLPKAPFRHKPVEPRLHPGDELELSPVEQRTAEHLRRVRAGTRFRIPVRDGEDSQLVTLTWFNSYTDRLLFVDLNGAKAALLPVPLLARYLHNGRAQLANQKQQPFFSRAIKALKGYLEKRIMTRQEMARA